MVTIERGKRKGVFYENIIIMNTLNIQLSAHIDLNYVSIHRFTMDPYAEDH